MCKALGKMCLYIIFPIYMLKLVSFFEKIFFGVEKLRSDPFRRKKIDSSLGASVVRFMNRLEVS